MQQLLKMWPLPPADVLDSDDHDERLLAHLSSMLQLHLQSPHTQHALLCLVALTKHLKSLTPYTNHGSLADSAGARIEYG